MATAEQLEAWACEAADQLAAKIGKDAQVIVMVLDPVADRYHSERRGNKGGVLYTLETCSRDIKANVLPGNPTLHR